MSRIGDGNQGGGIQGGWPGEASQGVKSLRRAITARLDGEPVDTDVAPMLPDLLTRPEALSGAVPQSDLHAPRPTNAVDPPSPGEELQIMRSVQRKLQNAVSQLGNSERGQAVHAMLESVKHYRSLKEEVLMRSELG